MTSTYLTNANLMSLTGWNISNGTMAQGGYQDHKNDGDVPVIEFYHSWNSNPNAGAIGSTKTFNFSQKPTLPAGYYRLAVNAFYREGGNGNGTNTKAYIYAGTKQQYVVGLNQGGLNGYTGSNDLYKAANAFSKGAFSNEFDFHVSEAGEVEIGFHGYIDTYCSWCILGPVTLYEYTAEDYMEDYRAKVAIATPLLSKKMNAAVLQALNDAIVEESTLVTVDDVQNAVSTLTGAINDANASISSYEQLKAAIDTYTAKTALLDSYGIAAANEAGASSANDAYNNGTATDGVTEKAALDAAFRAGVLATKQPGNGLDMTAYITNPDFNIGKINGWTKETPYGGNCAIQGGSRMEYWAGNASDRSKASFNIYQELTNLPAGAYTISADMYNSLNDEGGDYTVFSPTCGVYGSSDNEEVALVTEEGTTLKTYTTGEVIVANGNLIIGTKNTVTPMAARWFLFDNVKLTYARQLTSEEMYNTAIAAAQAFDVSTIPAAAKEALQTTISNNTLTSGTPAQYNAAAAALNEAVTTAKSLVIPYADWKALKTQADALVAVSNNNASANSTLSSSITTQNAAVEAATTAEAITTASSDLKADMITYVKTAEPTNDECFDLTFMITNSHFIEGKGGTQIPTGWTLESGGITEHRLLTHNFEAYHKTFNLSQTITGLSKGTYKVTLQGFARHDGSDTDKTNLYCGIVNQPIKSIKDEYSTGSVISGKKAMGDTNGEANDNGKYRPNGMSASYYYFQEMNPATNQLFYTNEVQTLITEAGDLKIGFKCETTSDWVIWDNFHLYYYGSAIAVTIDEDAASSAYAQDIENANITFKRSFNTTNWNTIALPFDLSDAETKAAFGNDVKVATYSETADGANSTVSFNTAADAAIAANTPVLLKTSTDKTSFTFNGKTIKAGEAIAAGTNFNFVGTYAASTTIAEGDWFIASDKVWKSKGATTIKGTHAYIKAKDTNASIANFYIDGVETTAVEALAIAGKNNGKLYNLNGQEVKNAQKGIYIQNGKKVVIK